MRNVLIALVVIAGSVQSQEPLNLTFRTGAELVVLDVSVLNKGGANVRDLKPENFRVYEDGKLQDIRQFSDEERPATIGLVVDSSGSMRQKRADVITAALDLIAASNPLDEVFVVNFNDEAVLGLPGNVSFSDDINVLRGALSFAKAEGKTALNDAVLLGIQQLGKGKWDKKALLVVSDGGDNNSVHGYKDVIASVQESRATIYTIGLFDDEDPDNNPKALRRLAEISGGQSFEPRQIDEMSDLCRRIAKDIRGRYTLAYTPVRKSEAASLRSLNVVALDNSGKKLRVHTRTRYVLPEAPELSPRTAHP